MVHFKKDKDKPSKKRELFSYLAIFLSGFIIAVFLVLYIVLHVVNSIRTNDNPSSSEIIDSSSEVISSDDESTIDSSIDPYIDEKKIYDNLLTIVKEEYSDITSISSINCDTEYLYVNALSSDTFYIINLTYNDSIELTLEALIADRSVVEVMGDTNYGLNPTPSIDISNLDVFKNDDTYKGYNYKCKTLYNVDSSYIGMTSIGYKEDTYISITHIKYNESTSELNNIGTVISTSSDSSSIYYSFLSYLYSR